MMATISQPVLLPLESDELVLISHGRLRAQLLQARRFNDFCARSIVQRGESVYLSLREIPNNEQRQEISWAILRLQMGAQLELEELPEPLRSALSAHASTISPLIVASTGGAILGIVGGVLFMAIVGLFVIVFNVSADSYVGSMATAVAFTLSAACIGLTTTIYFWRKLTR